MSKDQLLQMLSQMFLTGRNILIVAMGWSLSLMVGKVIPASWSRSYRRHVVPLILMVVCMTSVWIPGLRPGLKDGQNEIASGTGISGEEIGWRLALGVILSVVAYALPIGLMWLAEKYLPEKVARSLRKLL